MARRLLRSLLFAAVLAAGAAADAPAADLSVENGVIVYTAAPGEIDEVAIFPACLPECASELPDTVNVYVPDVTAITPGPGCVPAVDIAFPPFVGPAYLCYGVTAGARIDLGDEDDFATAYAPGEAPVTVIAGEGNDFVGLYDSDDFVDGGPGNDQIFGGHGNDRIVGGEGGDELVGDYGSYAEGEDVGEDLEGAGADLLDGGPGDDRLEGNGGADVLAGGPGLDTAVYRARKDPVSISLDGVANDGQSSELDQVSADIEAIATGIGNDTVRGSDGAETITTGPGNDTVVAGGGEDIVDTGGGADSVEAGDGAVDKIGCGDGADSATLDAADVAGSDCEQQIRPASAGPPALPARVMPLGIVLRRLGAAPRAGGRLRLAGELKLPAGSDSRLCAGSSVNLVVRTPRTQRAVTTLGADCRFSIAVPLRLRRAGRVAASASFAGTSALGSAKSRVMRLRVRR